MRLDRRSGIGAPDDLIARRFDVFPFEQVFSFFVACKVDDPVALFPHFLGDGEQHGVAEPASRQKNVFLSFNFRWRAGWTHNHHGLARTKVSAQP